MQCPVGSLSGSVWTSRNLHEAVVEAQIVAKRVLPSLRVGSVVGESVCDVSAKEEGNKIISRYDKRLSTKGSNKVRDSGFVLFADVLRGFYGK